MDLGNIPLFVDKSRFYFLEIIVFLSFSRRLNKQKKISFDVFSLINRFVEKNKDWNWFFSNLKLLRINFSSLNFSLLCILNRSICFQFWNPTSRGLVLHDSVLNECYFFKNLSFNHSHFAVTNPFHFSILRKDITFILLFLLQLENLDSNHDISFKLNVDNKYLFSKISDIFIYSSNFSPLSLTHLIFQSNLTTFVSHIFSSFQSEMLTELNRPSKFPFYELFQNCQHCDTFSCFELENLDLYNFNFELNLLDFLYLFKNLNEKLIFQSYSINFFNSLKYFICCPSESKFNNCISLLCNNPSLMVYFRDNFFKIKGYSNNVFLKDRVYFKKTFCRCSYQCEYGRNFFSDWEIFDPKVLDVCAANILNYNFVQFPVSFDDHTFANARKIPLEDLRFKLEDERFELDIVIETALCTLWRMNSLLIQVRSLTSRDYSILFSSSIVRSTLLRIYGDKYHLIITSIFHEPQFTVPIILSRINKRIFEWKEAQFHFNRVWRENMEKNILKGMDLPINIFLNADIKDFDLSLFMDLDNAFDSGDCSPFYQSLFLKDENDFDISSCIDAINLTENFLKTNFEDSQKIPILIEFLNYFFVRDNSHPGSDCFFHYSGVLFPQKNSISDDSSFYCSTNWYLFISNFYFITNRLLSLKNFLKYSLQRYISTTILTSNTPFDSNFGASDYFRSLYGVFYEFLMEYTTGDVNLSDFDDLIKSVFGKYFCLPFNFSRFFSVIIKESLKIVNDNLFSIILSLFYCSHPYFPNNYLSLYKKFVDDEFFVQVSFNFITRKIKFILIHNIQESTMKTESHEIICNSKLKVYPNKLRFSNLVSRNNLFNINQHYLKDNSFWDRLRDFSYFSYHAMSYLETDCDFFYIFYFLRFLNKREVELKIQRSEIFLKLLQHI